MSRPAFSTAAGHAGASGTPARPQNPHVFVGDNACSLHNVENAPRAQRKFISFNKTVLPRLHPEFKLRPRTFEPLPGRPSFLPALRCETQEPNLEASGPENEVAKDPEPAEARDGEATSRGLRGLDLLRKDLELAAKFASKLLGQLPPGAIPIPRFQSPPGRRQGGAATRPQPTDGVTPDGPRSESESEPAPPPSPSRRPKVIGAGAGAGAGAGVGAEAASSIRPARPGPGPGSESESEDRDMGPPGVSPRGMKAPAEFRSKILQGAVDWEAKWRRRSMRVAKQSSKLFKSVGNELMLGTQIFLEVAWGTRVVLKALDAAVRTTAALAGAAVGSPLIKSLLKPSASLAPDPGSSAQPVPPPPQTPTEEETAIRIQTPQPGTTVVTVSTQAVASPPPASGSPSDPDATSAGPSTPFRSPGMAARIETTAPDGQSPMSTNWLLGKLMNENASRAPPAAKPAQASEVAQAVPSQIVPAEITALPVVAASAEKLTVIPSEPLFQSDLLDFIVELLDDDEQDDSDSDCPPPARSESESEPTRKGPVPLLGPFHRREA